MTILDSSVEFGLTSWAAHKAKLPLARYCKSSQLPKWKRSILAVANAATAVVGSLETAATFDALAYHNERPLLKLAADSAAPNGWIAFFDLP